MERLDAARDQLAIAGRLLRNFRFPPGIGFDDVNLCDEIAQHALEISLLADVVYGVIDDSPGANSES